MNIWHDIAPSRITTKSFEAYIEIPNGSKAKYELTTTSEHKLKLPRIKKKKTSAIKDKFILTTLQRFKMNVISKEGHQRKYNSGYYEMPMCHSLMCIENNNK